TSIQRSIVKLGWGAGGYVPIRADVDETRAIAIAAMSYAYALAGMLKRTGVLHSGAIQNTLQAPLLSGENTLSPDDRSTSIARQLLELMAAQLAAHVEPIKSPAEPPPKPGLIRVRSSSGQAAARSKISSR